MTKIQKIIQTPLFLIVITLIAGIYGWSLLQTQEELKQAQLGLEAEKEQLESLKLEKESLEKSLNASQESFQQERLIRDQLLMQKEGEIIIDLPREDLPADLNNLELNNTPEKSNLRKWIEEVF